MAYTNSPLVSYTKLSPNHSGQRNHSIDTITIHCVVGQCTVQTLGEVFAPVSRQASSNYGVGLDGKIGMYVEEKNRSWCTSSPSNDHRAITIEVASDTKEPYAVRDVAYNATIQLVADICKRNGIKKLVWSTDKSTRMNHLNGCNMTVHRDYANKSCPGKYLYDRMGDIAAKVNAILGTNETTPAPAPSTDSALQFKVGDIVNFAGGTHYTNANADSGSAVKASKAKITQTYNGKHPYHCRAVNDAGNFISGVYGWVDANTLSAIPSAPTVKTELKVGDIVNFAGGTHYTNANASTGPAAKPGQAKITAISKGGKHPYHIVHADSSSNVYGWVDANTLSAIPSAPTSSGKSIDELAKEIIRGDWGNGDDRKNRLTAAGYDYNAVQKLVNELLS